MASVVPKPWWRLLEIRNEGGRKNSEVVFPTSDVEKFSSEVEISISELFFACRRLVLFGALMDVLMGYVYQSTHLPASDGCPLRGRSAVPVVYRRFAVTARRLTLRLLRGVPFGDGNSCCHSFSLCGENVLLCIPLMGNDCCASPLWAMKDDARDQARHSDICCASSLWVMKDDVGEIYLIFNF